jgi:hypothetical protein
MDNRQSNDESRMSSTMQPKPMSSNIFVNFANNSDFDR